MTAMYSDVMTGHVRRTYSCSNSKAFFAHKSYNKSLDDFEHVWMLQVLIHCIAQPVDVCCIGAFLLTAAFYCSSICWSNVVNQDFNILCPLQPMYCVRHNECNDRGLAMQCKSI